jgi:bifunctional DNase/RNase
MLEMKVRGLTLDPLTNMALVILRDLEGTKALPIWVGIPEANAIALEIEQVSTPRPMTHDLIKNFLDGVNATVTRIVVNDLNR